MMQFPIFIVAAGLLEGYHVVCQEIPPSMNYTVEHGEDIFLPCVAPAVWFKDGTDITTLGIDSRVTISSEDGGLTMLGASIEDTGWYRCEVLDSGNPPLSVQFHVVVETTNQASIPASEFYFAVGRNATIPCHIIGYPRPTRVDWSRNGQLLNLVNSRYSSNNQSWALTIYNVTEGDTNYYKCQPFNRIGLGISSRLVYVQIRPGPMITVSPEPMYVSEAGSDITLNCAAQLEGSPLTSRNITWLKADLPLLVSDRTSFLPGGSLQILQLEASDSGQYRCVAFANQVNTTVSTQLSVVSTTPAPPSDISGVFSQFAASVRWTPGFDGGSAQQFYISYRVNGYRVTEWQTVPAEELTKHTLYYLEPAVTYEIYVQASNDLGDAPASETIFGQTLGYVDGGVSVLPRGPSGEFYYPEISRQLGPRPPAPERFTAEKTDGVIILKWAKPDSSEVPILYYQLEYRRDKIDSDYIRLNPIPVNRSSYSFTTVNQTRNQATYFFRVRASALLAYSDYSKSISIVVPDALLSDGAIVGISLASVLFLAILIVACVLIRSSLKRKNSKKGQLRLNGGSHYSYNTSQRPPRDRSFYPYTHGRFSVESDNDSHVYVANPSYLHDRPVPPYYYHPETIRSQSSNHSYNIYTDSSQMHGFYDVRTGRKISPIPKHPGYESSEDKTTLGGQSQGSRYVGQFDQDPDIGAWFIPNGGGAGHYENLQHPVDNNPNGPATSAATNPKSQTMEKHADIKPKANQQYNSRQQQQSAGDSEKQSRYRRNRDKHRRGPVLGTSYYHYQSPQDDQELSSTGFQTG